MRLSSIFVLIGILFLAITGYAQTYSVSVSTKRVYANPCDSQDYRWVLTTQGSTSSTIERTDGNQPVWFIEERPLWSGNSTTGIISISIDAWENQEICIPLFPCYVEKDCHTEESFTLNITNYPLGKSNSFTQFTSNGWWGVEYEFSYTIIPNNPFTSSRYLGTNRNCSDKLVTLNTNTPIGANAQDHVTFEWEYLISNMQSQCTWVDNPDYCGPCSGGGGGQQQTPIKAQVATTQRPCCNYPRQIQKCEMVETGLWIPLKRVSAQSNGGNYTFSMAQFARDAGISSTQTVKFRVRTTTNNLNASISSSWKETSASIEPISIPATPNLPASAVTISCGNSSIAKNNGSWYWQTSESGTDNTSSFATENVKSATSPTSYYLRAYSSGCWSPAQVISTFDGWKYLPDAPQLQTTYGCSEAYISFIGTVPPLGVSWIWTDVVLSEADQKKSPRRVTTSGMYKAKAVSSQGCPSAEVSVDVSSGWRTAPVAPTASITSYGCDRADITFNGTPDPGIVWYLRNNDSNGTILSTYSSLAGSQTCTVTKPGTYYVTASSGSCRSANSNQVSFTFWKSTPAAPPAIPDPIYRCGSAVVNVPSGQPNGIDWYWQSSPEGQETTTTGSISVAQPSDHYLRARSYGCWSPATKISTMPGWKYKPAKPTYVDMVAENYVCATNLKPLVGFNSIDKKTYVMQYQWTIRGGVPPYTPINTREKSPLLVLAAGIYTLQLDLVLGYSGNECTSTATQSRSIAVADYHPSIETTNINVTTPVIDQVINASASTFSDSWPLPPDVTGLLSTNSFLNGTQGVWRNNGAYAYKSENERAKFDGTNLKTAGTFSLNSFDWPTAQLDVVPNWVKSNAMTLYNAYGNELENKDVLGIYSSALYDYGGHLPTATGSNMRNNEMAFTGFEVQSTDASKALTLTELTTGNFVFGNQPKPNLAFDVPFAVEYAAIVDATMDDLALVNKVDIRAEKASWFNYGSKEVNYLQNVNIICKSPHPNNPRQTLIVLDKAPFSSPDQSFESSWNGQLIFITTPSVPVSFGLDTAMHHTGNCSLKISGPDQTFDQPLLALDGGKTYLLSGWIMKSNSNASAGISILIKDKLGVLKETVVLSPSGPVIEGWQQVKGTFTLSISKSLISLQFRPGSADPVWFDDLRLHPQNGNMKSYVYNLSDYRLRAILDEENFASLFYYDTEGNLYLTKKETEKGMKTLTENVSYQVKRP